MEDYVVCFEVDQLTSDLIGHYTFYQELEDLIYFIAKAANFTYSKKSIADKLWTQMLLAEECDMAVGLLSLHEQIGVVFQYCSIFFITKVVILSGLLKKKSGLSSLDMNYQLLAGVFISIAILSVLSTLAERIVSRFFTEKEKKIGLSHTIWMYFSSLFMEPIQEQISTSSNVAVTVWWFALVVILSVIGGTIKADMAASQKSQLETLEDILDHPKLKIILPQNSVVSRFIEGNSEFGIRNATHGHLKTWMLAESLGEISNGQTIMIHDEFFMLELLKSNTDKTQKKLHLSKTPLLGISKHLFTHDGVPLDVLELMNQKGLYFFSTLQMTPRMRFMFRLVDDYLAHEGPVFQSEILFLIYVYGVGVATSAVILLLEIAYHYLAKVRYRNTCAALSCSF